MTEPLLLTTTRVQTFDGEQTLTAASGFFFARDESVFLVTSRHVLSDPGAGHRPNRIEFRLHTDPKNLTLTHTVSTWLYQDGTSVWRQGRDAGGDIDVAVVAIDRAQLPPPAGWRCFTPGHLLNSLQEVQVGRPLLIIGFPLGFHDTVYQLPVARQAIVASAFGVRFQGQGLFLTDARTHRGLSGGPVVIHDPAGDPQMPWKLLGVHSSRIDMNTRDLVQDESLGLNSAWYADILLTLTA
jgi:S1-C subfamily serine protease